MRIIAVLVVLASLACSNGVAEPRPFGDALPITVTPVETRDTSQVVYLGNDGNLIYLRGRIATPDPCYDVSAYRTLDGRELRVTIVAARRTRGCASVIDHFDYQTLTDRPDCPHLTVWYHFEGGAWPDRKLVDETWYCASAAVRDRQAAGRLM